MDSSVDVAIFVLNEEAQLFQTIEQLRPIEYIGHRIVVTPNSSIATRLGTDPTITVIEEKQREGKNSAVNKALALSKSRDFLHISGDTRVTTEGIRLLIETMATGRYGSVTSHVMTTGDKDTIAGCVNGLIWEIYNETNHYLNPMQCAKTGDVYIVRKALVPEIASWIINDDAFIDGRLRRGGFGTIEVEAPVWVRTPRTPWGHLMQRSRVIQGHLQLVKEHEESPDTVEFSRHLTLGQRVHIISKAVRHDRRYIKALFGLILLEGMSWGLAFIYMLRGRANLIWRRES